MTMTSALQHHTTWTEDRAPVRTDPSAVPGAETEGRAVAITSAARPSLRDRLPCEKPSRPEAATNTARCLDAFPYALTAKFQFTLNQDKMTRTPAGCTGRERVFVEMAVAVAGRDPNRRKTLVCLLDGERALWEMAGEWLPRAVGVLDLFHVLERLWTAAHCFHAEGSADAAEFVSHRLEMLLEGKVGYVIGGLTRLCAEHRLKGEKRGRLMAAITYYENNREHMRYDEYLAAGYPIGSGVAEGACRHLVKDRMEGTGMRWTVEGAQAMLHLRAVYLNGRWDDFIEYHIQAEQERLYRRAAA